MLKINIKPSLKSRITNLVQKGNRYEDYIKEEEKNEKNATSIEKIEKLGYQVSENWTNKASVLYVKRSSTESTKEKTAKAKNIPIVYLGESNVSVN